MNHIFRNAAAAEYISNYNIFSLNYDKEHESEIEFIADEIGYFLGKLKEIESEYPENNIDDTWGKIKKEEAEGREKINMDLFKELKAVTERGSLKNKVKYLEKKLIELGCLYEIIDDKINITSPEKEEDNDNDKSLAYKIALLSELGFFELEKFRGLESKTKQYRVIKKLLGYSERDIAGNIRCLNPDTKSKDFGNPKYNSYSFIEEVKKLLK